MAGREMGLELKAVQRETVAQEEKFETPIGKHAVKAKEKSHKKCSLKREYGTMD